VEFCGGPSSNEVPRIYSRTPAHGMNYRQTATTNIIAAVAKMSPRMCEAYPSTSRTLEAAFSNPAQVKCLGPYVC
jgi:hypothetical protein